MLVSLTDMKTYLGISDASFDAFLTQQIGLISEAIEGYCGRKFAQTNYVQTFHRDDYHAPQKELYLYHYPIIGPVVIKDEDDNVLDAGDYRVQKELAHLKMEEEYFLRHTRSKVKVEFTAGYATVPLLIQSVVYDIVEQRYNKKVSGVALNFGSDVQRISIPGTLSIDYDYSLSTNERKSKFGTILGNNLNVLDSFRSERGIGQYGTIAYLG